MAACACGGPSSGPAGTGDNTSPGSGSGGMAASHNGSGSGGQSRTTTKKSSSGGPATGGLTGSGSIEALGGSTVSAGQGGALSSQSGTQGRTGSSAQGGRSPGGSAFAGGSTAIGGQAAEGGQAVRSTGGSGHTGGSTIATAQGAASGKSGPGTGGSGQSGGSTGSCGQLAAAQRSISFGTLLDAKAVMCVAQQLAKSLTNPSSSQWQAKGDQHRKYRFEGANTDEPYRLYVPTNWDGKSSLPLAMFLHGSGSNENTYVDSNNKQMVNLAQEHGYVLVAPLGDKGAYGNFLRLASPFGSPEEATKLMAQVTADSERTNELSEEDVINVLELVMAEYPIDRTSMFLFGHSMGSGGTWYIGGKYATYWRGLAPMSGPFVQETGYPWDDLKKVSLFVTEGTQTPSVDGSHELRDWLKENGFDSVYKEVNADHGGMIPLVLPDVFDFFDRSRAP